MLIDPHERASNAAQALVENDTARYQYLRKRMGECFRGDADHYLKNEVLQRLVADAQGDQEHLSVLFDALVDILPEADELLLETLVEAALRLDDLVERGKLLEAACQLVSPAFAKRFFDDSEVRVVYPESVRLACAGASG